MDAHPRRRDRARWRGSLVLAAKIAIAVVAVVFGLRLIRRIDWDQVFESIGRLSVAQVAVLSALMLAMQLLNSLPLGPLVPGLPARRAVQSGMAGTLITTFLPPPSETVLRMSMLRSWGVEATVAAAALALNTVSIYLARFAVPILGLLLALTTSTVSGTHWLTAAIGAVTVSVLVGALALVVRGERAAARVGTVIGGAAHRVRRSIDPQRCVDALVDFQRNSSTDLTRRLGPATGLVVASLIVDGTILTASLRFVGVPGSGLSWAVVVGALLCLYPLTVLPFLGIGALDASLVVLLTQVYEAPPADMVAALVVWRVTQLALPLVPGAAALLLWRRSQPPTAGSAPAGERAAGLVRPTGPLRPGSPVD